MVISDVTKYKQRIMKELIGIPDLFTLMNNSSILKPSEMVDQNIYSYMRIPSVTTTVKNYICFDYNSRILATNSTLKNVSINISTICHESEINVPWGNRHDVIAGLITESFNWSKFLGFDLELINDNESILKDLYHVRTLQFRNLTPNSLENGAKMDGY